jgi:hypothetical protein
MQRTGGSGIGKSAAVVAAATAVGLIAVLSIALVADGVVALHKASDELPASVADRQSSVVNRDGKADALPASKISTQRIPIKTVEVVGIRNAAIVYRDREGNILFRTDPVANVTVVSKNVDLPEVTIRDTATTEVKRMSVDRPEPGPSLANSRKVASQPSPVLRRPH